jgi:hypothetical protein
LALRIVLDYPPGAGGGARQAFEHVLWTCIGGKQCDKGEDDKGRARGENVGEGRAHDRQAGQARRRDFLENAAMPAGSSVSGKRCRGADGGRSSGGVRAA